MTEWLGIGVWGNERHAPDVKADELSDAILRVIGNHEEGVSMQRKAKQLGSLFAGRSGRDVAAEKIVQSLRAHDPRNSVSATQRTTKDEL